MDLDTQFKIKNNPHYKRYIRENSSWYKILNRYPERFSEFENEVKDKYKLRMSDRISNVLDNIEMIEAILSSIR